MALRQALRQLVQSFSLANIRARLLRQDGRRLQQELDTHKLFLYVNLHQQLKSKGVDALDTTELLAQTQDISFTQKRALLQQLITQQVLEMADCVHEALVALGDPALAAGAFEQPPAPEPAPEQQMQADLPISGLAYAGLAAVRDEEGGKLVASLSQVSHQAAARLGFRLGVRHSQIGHGAAGNGLFVEEGQVPPGQVLALFPGLVYTAATYSAMPNYPRVDADNPYLIARYDKAVVDSKPWGPGLLSAAPGAWPEPTSPAAQQLRVLEGRHPYALAHYANHPGAGMQPNAMIAPFIAPKFRAREGADSADACLGPGSQPETGGAAAPAAGAADATKAAAVSGSGGVTTDGEKTAGISGRQQEQQQQQQQQANYLARPRLRAYLPNVWYSADSNRSRPQLLDDEVSAVALVACQRINAGEEVLFDYRLSPGLGRPDWYVAVDSSAEMRRWS